MLIWHLKSIPVVLKIFQGIKYMHDSPLDSHGHLKSTNCVIDDRWTLKITDYGLTQFRVPSDADEQNESDMYRGMEKKTLDMYS